jgi:hypothetical protein
MLKIMLKVLLYFTNTAVRTSKSRIMDFCFRLEFNYKFQHQRNLHSMQSVCFICVIYTCREGTNQGKSN